MEIIWLDKKWLEYITYMPSQLYRRFNLRNVVYTVYLRWRYDDPWQCMIVTGDLVCNRYENMAQDNDQASVIKWSDDLFLSNQIWISCEEYKQAEKCAEEITEKLLWVKEIKVGDTK